jgi:hypothetical protein
MGLKNKILIILTVISSHFAWADDLQLGAPSYGGTGCPVGSASFTLSPDGKSVIGLFDSFANQLGVAAGRLSDRKSCNIVVPIHVPQGYSVALGDLGVFSGFNSLPTGAVSTLTIQSFWSGGTGPTFARTFRGPLNDNFDFLTTSQLSSFNWSPCGVDVNLRLNITLMTKSPNGIEAFSNLDKLTSSKFLQWRRCR